MMRKNSRLSKSQFSLFQSYQNRDLFVQEYPKYLVIETTNICNLECLMCPRKNMTRPVGYMDFEVFRKIIDEVQGKVEFIYLHFFGEPLLHENIFKFIDYAGGKGITIAFSTNAVPLNLEITKNLLKSKLDLLILSVDSLQQGTYETIRHRGKYRRTICNVERFLDEHEKSGSMLNVVLQMIQMRINEHEILNFRRKWEQRSGVNVCIKHLHDYAGQVSDIDNLGAAFHKNSEPLVCVEPWRGMVIGWDGTVVPCCNDFDYKCILGNVREKTLYDVWNGTLMNKLRESQVKNNPPALCLKCSTPTESDTTGASFLSKFNPSQLECHAYFDSGLYGLECGSEYYSYIWTQKHFELLIQDRFADVTISIRNNNPIHECLEMEIKLFDKDFSRLQITRHTNILLTTPAHLKGRLLRYKFSLNHDWIPRDYGINQDQRTLGVMIESITH